MNELKGLQYRGYGRYLCIIASGADAEAFVPILQEIRKHSFRVFCDPAAKPVHMLDQLDAASAVLVFVSERFAGDDSLRDAVAYASCLGKPLISVYLEDAVLPDGLAMLLNSRQALLLSDYPDAETFYEKLFSSKTMTEMRASKVQILRRFRVAGGILKALCLIAAALVLTVVLLLSRLLRPFEKEQIVTTETARQTAQPASEAVQTEQATPIRPGTPLTIEELEAIQGLWIIGDQFIVSTDSNENAHKWTQMSRGNIGDLSDLVQFPNLTNIRLYKQSGTVDLTPLFACKNLRRIYLNDVPNVSFAGIEHMRQLSVLSIDDCGRIDLAPLAECDFSYADAESSGFRLSVSGTQLLDPAALGSVRRYRLLSTDIAVSDIAPALQNCSEIDELVCTNVGSMAAFGKLPCVRSLTVQDDRVTELTGMEGLAGLETLNISANLKHIGEVGAMPNMRRIISGTDVSGNRKENPISDIDGLPEAFPNLQKATFPMLTDGERAKLKSFLDGNQ